MKVIVTKNPKKLELINPTNGIWAVRWNIKNLDETSDICNQKNFNHKPSLLEIKEYICQDANAECVKEITNDFVWNDRPVYLNKENQNNFTIVYNTAKSSPELFPVTLKFGASDFTEYQVFDTFEELEDFYIKMGKHIASCLNKCWEIKSNINLEEYK